MAVPKKVKKHEYFVKLKTIPANIPFSCSLDARSKKEALTATKKHFGYLGKSKILSIELIK